MFVKELVQDCLLLIEIQIYQLPYHKPVYMKRAYIYFIFLTLINVDHAVAQINKGAIFLGGDLAFSSEKGNSSNNTGYNTFGGYILPVLGKAVSDNSIVGISLLYNYNNSDVALDFNDRKQWVYGGGFFIREYYPLHKTKFSLFVQGSLFAEHDHIEQAYNTIDKIETRTFSINSSAFPGVSYNLSNKLKVETGFVNLFGVRYFHRKTTTGTINPLSSSATGFSLYASAENVTRFNVGFRLLLGKSREN